ncbi:hypothetical protein F5Y10DRAFT_268264 [Nemania abortiva]|nr:hypothetical protein F5Y10DRAFT_268264 [Nemania abortiva]
MRIPRQNIQCDSLTPEPTSTSQPSTPESIPIRESSFSHPAFHSDDFVSEDDDEAYLFNALSSQTPGVQATGIPAGQEEGLVEIVSNTVGFAVSPPSHSSKRRRDGRLPPRGGKWLRTFEEGLGIDGEGTVAGGSPMLQTKHLPCPFHVRYGDCCCTQVNMRGIDNLKRHLWTAHLQPSYCPICYDTFGLAQDWENHVRRASCVSSGRTRPEGISGLQVQQLARRTDPWVSRETQWLLIWETVFPGAKPPSLGSISSEV